MKKGRRPYQKPQIKEVKLIPEEAVLKVCKSPVGTGARPGNCRGSGLICRIKAVGS
jgi:hypothetical protein